MQTVVREGEVLRHGLFTRVVHWLVALFFVLSLLSGFALFSPWLYAWMAPLFGGGPRARLLHPWFGMAFVAVFAGLLFQWFVPMRWQSSDRLWLRRIREYVTNQHRGEPDYVGKFNAGQKLWFWAIVVCAILFLVSGFFLWWPELFGRRLMWVSYLVHDVAGLLMLAGFIVHLYEGTAAMPGTFRSMTRGTVTERWARTYHPAWRREVTARTPDRSS